MADRFSTNSTRMAILDPIQLAAISVMTEVTPLPFRSHATTTRTIPGLAAQLGLTVVTSFGPILPRPKRSLPMSARKTKEIDICALIMPLLMELKNISVHSLSIKHDAPLELSRSGKNF